ncbi:MAG: hypothetical protein ACRBBN_10500 [Methyloligellaceae bacterium]
MTKPLIAMLIALTLNSYMIQAATAQDKHHPSVPKPPRLVESGIVKHPCSLYCRLQNLLKLLQDIEITIDIHLDFRFYLEITPGDKVRLEEKLSELERDLTKTGKIPVVLKQELADLRRMIKNS